MVTEPYNGSRTRLVNQDGRAFDGFIVFIVRYTPSRDFDTKLWEGYSLDKTKQVNYYKHK